MLFGAYWSKSRKSISPLTPTEPSGLTVWTCILSISLVCSTVAPRAALLLLWAVNVVPATAPGSLNATSTGAPIPTVVGAGEESTQRGSSNSNLPRSDGREVERETLRCGEVRPS